MSNESIVVVSGLPRSGTSMVMQMLAAGGIPALTDNLRTPDDDNPQGYLELEKVKQLESDSSWVGEASGKAVKVISALLRHLPPGHSYKVIFVHRNIGEVLASQRQMLIRRGESTDDATDEEMAAAFSKHVSDVKSWLERQPDFEVLTIQYRAAIDEPESTSRLIADFLGVDLDVDNMASAVNRSLYRQRSR